MKNIKILSIALLWIVSVECRPKNHANNHHDVAHYAVAAHGQKSHSFDHNKAVHKAGSVDTDFATDGFYENTTGTIIYAMQVQKDGKILIAGHESSDWYVGRLNTDGSVDTSFAANGFYEHSTGTTIHAMQTRQDGKILIAGYKGADWYVGRLNADGSLDTTFASDGFYSDGTGAVIRAMQIQQDGKILIAGYNDSINWYVGRLNADGSLDTTFASNGFYAGPTVTGRIYAMQLQTDGKILIAGNNDNISNTSYVGRLSADGVLDTTFASNGFYEDTTGAFVMGMGIQSDGKIILAGYTNGNDWRVGRLNTDGSLDTNFASNGFYAGPTDTNRAYVMQLQADDKIVLAGDNSSSNWYVGRLNADGSLDTDFAANGFYTNATGNIVYSIELQADGRILVAGDNGSSKWYIGRLHNDVDMHKHHIFHHSGESLGLLG